MIRSRWLFSLVLASGSCFGQLPVVNEFGCDHSVAQPGDAMTLFWNVEGATQISISAGIGVVNPTDVGEVAVRLPVDAAAGFSPELIPQGAVWKYDDDGIDLGETWRSEFFDDAAWKEGVGEFGFGEPSIVTTINRIPLQQSAVYFRKQIEISQFDADAPITFRFKRDDAIVVWINGVEFLRDNLAPGGNDFNERPFRPVIEEDSWVPVNIATLGQIFQEGVNTVAVSIHQFSPTSSDLRFDFDLDYTQELTPQFVYTLTASNASGSVTAELPIEVVLRGEPDYDRDGLPDEWEILNFGSLDGFGMDDPDADGLTNFEEFDLSRLPHVAGTGLQIGSIEPGVSQTRLEMPLFYGRDLGVEYSSDLTEGSWMQLGNFFQEGNAAVFIDPDPFRSQRERGFYRAFLRPASQR